ncbi:MAG: patatin-like phospholipase family protein [Pseudomonadota bacterium]
MTKRTVYILSLDGGGIRGVISAHILEILHATLAQPEGRTLGDMFDLVAGTSAGGILALGLTVPDANGQARYTPHDLKHLYAARGGEIFPPSRYGWMRTLRQVMRHKYDETGLETILDEILGEARISDAVTDLVVTSYDTVRRTPHYFRKPDLRTGPSAPDFLMRDAARATTAAPTYFKAHRCSAIGVQAQIEQYLAERFPEGRFPENYRANDFSLIDGGICLSNPSLTALMEAQKLFPDADEFVIVSVGTGKTNRPFPYDDISNWGALNWVGMIRGVPLLSMMMDGQSDNAEMMLAQFPRVQFFRFDIELVGANDDLDDASPANIEKLIDVADRAIDRGQNDLLRLASLFGHSEAGEPAAIMS